MSSGPGDRPNTVISVLLAPDQRVVIRRPNEVIATDDYAPSSSVRPTPAFPPRAAPSPGAIASLPSSEAVRRMKRPLPPRYLAPSGRAGNAQLLRALGAGKTGFEPALVGAALGTVSCARWRPAAQPVPRRLETLCQKSCVWPGLAVWHSMGWRVTTYAPQRIRTSDLGSRGPTLSTGRAKLLRPPPLASGEWRGNEPPPDRAFADVR